MMTATYNGIGDKSPDNHTYEGVNRVIGRPLNVVDSYSIWQYIRTALFNRFLPTRPRIFLLNQRSHSQSSLARHGLT